jgi:hypothetical protein
MHRHGYADDIQLYDFFELTSQGLQAAIRRAEKCVSDIRRWLKPNYFKGNDDKTEFLHCSEKKNAET